MKKRLFAMMMTMIMVVGAVAFTGCGSDKAASSAAGSGEGTNEAAAAAAADDVLVVGLDDTFAPMGFRDDDGNIVGFDVDLATAVAEELGMEVEFKPIDWNAKEAELSAGTIDCIWNGMSVTPERVENMAMTAQYLQNTILLMTLANNDLDVTDASQLANLKIGTQTDSSALDMLKENEAYESYKDNIVEYDTYDVAIMDLKAGRVDVLAIDKVLGEYTNKNMNGEMKECTYSMGDEYFAIGFYKDNTELRDKVDGALKTIIDNGKAGEISMKWFQEDNMVYEPIEGEE